MAVNSEIITLRMHRDLTEKWLEEMKVELYRARLSVSFYKERILKLQYELEDVAAEIEHTEYSMLEEDFMSDLYNGVLKKQYIEEYCNSDHSRVRISGNGNRCWKQYRRNQYR